MPLWDNRSGHATMRKAELARRNYRINAASTQAKETVMSQRNETIAQANPVTAEPNLPRDIFALLPETGSDNELDFYLHGCEILDPKTTKRVHMQVVIVWAFYNYPDITNEELTELITQRFPGSVWNGNPDARCSTDRRKYNGGMFRCQGGWYPKKDDPHYAKPRTNEPAEDDEELDLDALAELIDEPHLDGEDE